MSFRTKLISVLCLLTLLLAGCGGSDDGFSVGNGDGDFSGGGSSSSDSSDDSSDSSSDDSSSDDGGEEVEEPLGDGSSPYSYRYLGVYEASDDFSGDGIGGLYQGKVTDELVMHFIINPINASTLASTDQATADDYLFYVDGIETDAFEAFPVMQKVLGNQVELSTALVFDISDSMSHADMDALIAEAKAYVTAAKASANEVIANQQYVVWAFARDTNNLIASFTANQATIETALDNVVVAYNADALGTSSNLHRAIVEAVGRYQKDAYDFLDGMGEDNDLIDIVLDDGVELSQMVVFSSGGDTFLEMDASLMVSAIESQALDVFVDGLSDPQKLSKPVMYYVVGDDEPGVEYATLSENAEVVEHVVTSAGAYDFADMLVQDQIDAIERRIDLDNQYLYRVAFLPRIGDHTSVFSSNSSDYVYTLTTSWDGDLLDPLLGTPAEELASLVEITGPEGEFLSDNQASLAEVDTFGFATRWTNTAYTAADYSWSIIAGTATLTVNADTTATISAKTSATVTLQLRNDTRGETAQVVISD